MRRAAMLVAAAAIMLGTTGLRAQSPNFSGTWTMVMDPNAATMGGGGMAPMTISQDAKTLTITRTMGGNEIKSVYNLDGSESKNTMTGRGGMTMESDSHAKWDEKKLVITTTREFNGNKITSTAAYWLDASGNLMIATTQPPRGGGDPVTTTRTFKKG